MPLKKDTSTSKPATKPAAEKTHADQTNEAANKPPVELVGDNKDLDPLSPEGQAWILEQDRLKQQQSDQDRVTEQQLEQKRRDDERLEREGKEAQAKLDRQAELDAQAKLDDELAKAQEQEHKGAPKPGRYAATKSRLRDPISGKSFLVSKSTIVKKADITKWFIKQYEAHLLTEFDEAEEEE